MPTPNNSNDSHENIEHYHVGETKELNQQQMMDYGDIPIEQNRSKFVTFSELSKNQDKYADIIRSGQVEAKNQLDKRNPGRIFNGFPLLIDENNFSNIEAILLTLKEGAANAAKNANMPVFEYETEILAATKPPSKTDKKQVEQSELPAGYEKIKGMGQKLIDTIIDFATKEIVDPTTSKVKKEIDDIILGNESKHTLNPEKTVSAYTELIFREMLVKLEDKLLRQEFGSEFVDNATQHLQYAEKNNIKGKARDEYLLAQVGEDYKKFFDRKRDLVSEISVLNTIFSERIADVKRYPNIDAPNDRTEEYIRSRVLLYNTNPLVQKYVAEYAKNGHDSVEAKNLKKQIFDNIPQMKDVKTVKKDSIFYSSAHQDGDRILKFAGDTFPQLANECSVEIAEKINEASRMNTAEREIRKQEVVQLGKLLVRMGRSDDLQTLLGVASEKTVKEEDISKMFDRLMTQQRHSISARGTDVQPLDEKKFKIEDKANIDKVNAVIENFKQLDKNNPNFSAELKQIQHEIRQLNSEILRLNQPESNRPILKALSDLNVMVIDMAKDISSRQSQSMRAGSSVVANAEQQQNDSPRMNRT